MNKRKSFCIFITGFITVFLMACDLPTSIGTNGIGKKEDYVENKKISVKYGVYDEPVELTGIYTGDVENGLPDGNGKIDFLSDDEEVIIKYVGGFKEGAVDGYGEATFYMDDSDLILKGTHKDGLYTPTLSEKYGDICRVGGFGSFELSDEVCEYINEYEGAFKNLHLSSDMKEVDFSYKEFIKTRKQSEIGVTKLELGISQIFEDEWLDGESVTSALVYDKDSNMYAIYFIGSEEIYDGDIIEVYAIPVATSSFENVSGGVTNVIDLIVCEIKKE